MMSEAAKARAVRRGPGAWGFLLAHHWPDQLDRCYQAWIANRPVWFCSRCCGVYPALFAALVVQLLVDISRGCNVCLTYHPVLPAPGSPPYAVHAQSCFHEEPDPVCRGRSWS